MDTEGPEADKGIFDRVLVPTDFSRPARNTLECVAEIPGVKEVILLHVIDASHPSRHGWIYNPEIENAKILLAEKKEHLEGRGLRIETRSRPSPGVTSLPQSLRLQKRSVSPSSSWAPGGEPW